jgi:hypothetical protein
MLPPSSMNDKVEAAGSSETSVNSYQSTWRHMQEDGILFYSLHYSAAVRFPTVPNRKQNFTHTPCSVLSAIIKIGEPPSRHLEKKTTTTITLNLD